MENFEKKVALIGVGCALPGASNKDAFWRILSDSQNVVKPRPVGRWSVERFLRPGERAPGFSYSFAGAYLDHPFAFDPAPFGISSREAEQIDPQQRLLLEVVWRAFEDAKLNPDEFKQERVGVYIGASTVDYQSNASHDFAAIDAHFMTGNSMSILANRISYIFDFHGPSLTIDTACSSSLVALHHARMALLSGEIDLAVVGGVNMLLSPLPFIGFSQARMLSPTGLSRPFSDEADGYVRAEGAVAVLLRRAPDALARGEDIQVLVANTAVNSDGRTSGISLPSLEGQRALLNETYRSVDANRLAFVEAHGTGTAVGDPIEAAAIGACLAQKRDTPLWIGSAKSNVGHLEPASGLVGLLKASLALKRGVFPASLLCDRPNSRIDFEALNLKVATEPIPLHISEARSLAGVCNFGFGGTNAHVILEAPLAASTQVPSVKMAQDHENNAAHSPRFLIVSAASQEALRARTGQIAALMGEGVMATDIAAAIAHQQKRLGFRLAAPVGVSNLSEQLRRFAAEEAVAAPVWTGVAGARAAKVAFVYSGNGCQYRGMGRSAYATSAVFRREIDAMDAEFSHLFGWSLRAALVDGAEDQRMSLTSVAQPLIFAVQSALTACLRSYGVREAAVLGHSVGEVAAAEASGALTRSQALHIIYHRSVLQEQVLGLGRMMVLACDHHKATDLIASASMRDVEIAAINGPSSTTVAGPETSLRELARFCRQNKVATVDLDLDYPFHTSALEPTRGELERRLFDLRPSDGPGVFISTVTGDRLDGSELGASYWWRNIREPVQFRQAVGKAADLGCDIFLEIGPKPILTSTLTDNLNAANSSTAALASLTARDSDEFDEVESLIARLISLGVEMREAASKSHAHRHINLPGYPFQKQDYAIAATPEALQVFGSLSHSAPQHPLLGARMAGGSPEWRNLIDVFRLPYLQDHVVDNSVVVPAAALIEMALAVGRDLHGPVPLELAQFDVTKALALSRGLTRELSTRYASSTGEVEIWSRDRLKDGNWILHARGTLKVLARSRSRALPLPDESQLVHDKAEDVYAEARRAGLDYGPAFQLVKRNERDEFTTHAWLESASNGLGAFQDLYVLNPVSLDAAFHGLFISRPQKDGETRVHLPVRFRKVCVWEPGARVARAITTLIKETDRYKTVAISLLNEDGAMSASIEAAVLRSVYFSKSSVSDRTFRHEKLKLSANAGLEHAVQEIGDALLAKPATLPDAWLLTRAFALSLAYHRLSDLVGEQDADLTVLPERMRIPAQGCDYYEALLALLAEHRLIETTDGVSRLKEGAGLPPPQTLLATLVGKFPEANVEIQLAAVALEHADERLRQGATQKPTHALQRRFESSALLVKPALEALSTAIRQLVGKTERKLSVVAIEPWSSGLLSILLPLAQTGYIELTLASESRAAIDTCRREIPAEAPVAYRVIADPAAALARRFDMLVGVTLSHAAVDSLSLTRLIGSWLVPGAPILLASPGQEPALDVLCGLWPDVLRRGPAGFVTGAMPPAARVSAALAEAGACGVRQIELGEGCGCILSAMADTVAFSDSETVHAEFIISPELNPVLPWGARGVRAVPVESASSALARALEGMADTPVRVYVMPHCQEQAPAEQLAKRIETLKSVMETLEASTRYSELCLVTRDAQTDTEVCRAVDAALYGFGRVAMNEYPALAIKLIDLQCGATMDDIPSALEANPGEREFCATPEGVFVNRIKRNIEQDEPLCADERSVLRFLQPGRIDHFQWIRQRRLSPAFGEVEIEVAAVGLNFRDVLVGLGVLDDDLLGAGQTGGALGFECSGRVVRLGEGVEHLKLGDEVMGFAAGALASHITSPAWHFFRTPQGVTLEAAATIPVAFATAWYALMERAALRTGEDVLIHGAAGGVGLAAVQIAKRAGARITGSASSPARRAIARAAGAGAVCDSRKERFVEQIRDNSDGVDVVLNSLAGQAMLSSFDLVKPFGRFIELGKRDYLDNTHLGLRPFVRNIMYCGVDLDELLAHDAAAVERIMTTLAGLFDQGELRPLPYEMFEASEVGDAFRTMQASEHVGKIVIRPANSARLDPDCDQFSAREGAYLIVGGTSGLGFATAQWLAAKGATTVILASRRGAVEEDIAEECERLRKRGVTVVVEKLDVVDGAAVAACVKRNSAAYGPLRGVVHAAVQLDDGLIAGLQGDRLRAVLRTKIDGAINLDRATREEPLDFFVVYSSATTLIGSPGQSAYVAANAFLEGFARQRRARGLPALAIGWGAISDVGIIARNQGLGQKLRRTTGVVGIRASEALAHLGRLLAAGDRLDPVQFYTNISPSSAADKLALLNSPTFLALDLARHEIRAEENDDLASLIAGKSRSEALEIVTQALRREMANILRIDEAQIDPRRALAELGFDSLMALELNMSVEKLSGAQLSMMGTADRSLGDIAFAVLQQLSAEEGAADSAELTSAQAQMMTLARRHSESAITADDVRQLDRTIAEIGNG